ncbi:NAD(P)-dependent oxidoreductase [Dactylosporangium sp. McL0621]|uniref:NAD(P)-dependent oxidoreductase n=1 Tax=Dactylosporangium sp. McL0621 TaxID=3415678 RepID=UPI003CF2B3C9
MDHIAVLGLGRMGAAIAVRLAEAGWAVTGWNRTPRGPLPGVTVTTDLAAVEARIGAGNEAGAEAAVGTGNEAGVEAGAGAGSETGGGAAVETGSEAGVRAAVGTGNEAGVEAGNQAGVVITMLTDGAAVQDVLGRARLRAGTVVVEMSTIGPDAVRAVAAGLPDGVALVDAPVGGSVGAAAAGRLRIFAGGDAADVARVRPVLDALGDVRHCGPLGSGAAAKVVLNAAMISAVAALADVLVVAEAVGLPRAGAVELMRAGPLAFAAERTLGAAAERTLGATEERTLGTAEGRTLGTAEARALGTAEGRTLGTAEARALGTAEERTLGTAEARALGTAEGRALGTAAVRTVGAGRPAAHFTNALAAKDLDLAIAAVEGKTGRRGGLPVVGAARAVVGRAVPDADIAVLVREA